MKWSQIYVKDRTSWKELDDDLIYYQNDRQHDYSHLRIRNIQADKSMEYFNILPYNLGVLKKDNSYLRIFIETQAQTLIAKLDRNSLNLKIIYTICYKNHGRIYYLNNIHLMPQNKRFIQMFKNKYIRRIKGKPLEIVEDNILKRIELKLFSQLSKGCYQFFYQFYLIFEKQFNISLQHIDDTYGKHIIKKIGNFLILKKYQKYQINQEGLPVYYIIIDFIIKGYGTKGKIYLNHNENLKMIKCLDNILYVVIAQDGYFKVYEINGEHERKSIYWVPDKQKLKKPILQQKQIIFTNKMNRFIPEVQDIDYKKMNTNYDYQDKQFLL